MDPENMPAKSEINSLEETDEIAPSLPLLPESVDSESNALVKLLKSPQMFITEIKHTPDELKEWLTLLIAGAAFHAIYGFAAGMFGGWGTALMAMCKAPLIALCSLALCMPSLYIFACVSSVPLTLKQALRFAGGVMAMTGLILIAMAPVGWLFSVSTSSVGFIAFLNVAIWGIAMIFAISLLKHLSFSLRRSVTGVFFWIIIYIVVTLQMSTCMRPLLSMPEHGWFAGGKKFFLIHFSETMQNEITDRGSVNSTD
ncbi:hypothetical protein JXA32_05055 [Candidatus Sumerlaeota bacterium]|nr:hypothetical protein [Candidatus Sumerlaeota bacterium]